MFVNVLVINFYSLLKNEEQFIVFVRCNVCMVLVLFGRILSISTMLPHPKNVGNITDNVLTRI